MLCNALFVIIISPEQSSRSNRIPVADNFLCATLVVYRMSFDVTIFFPSLFNISSFINKACSSVNTGNYVDFIPFLYVENKQ